MPYNNVLMEHYYNSLKEELIKNYRFRTYEELNYAISEYAYKWHNQVRPQTYNGYKIPFEMRYNLSASR